MAEHKDGKSFTELRPLRVLIISPEAGLTWMADLIAAGGGEVRIYSRYSIEAIEGVSHVRGWRPNMRWADLIVTDAPLILSKATLTRYAKKLIYHGKATHYEGMGRVLILPDDPVAPVRRRWKFWRNNG